MKGLIIKDILNLKKQFKTILFIIITYSVFFSMSFSTENSNVEPSIISGIMIFLSITISISSFSYDEYSKWDKYAASLPISRKTIVLSKYILSMLFLIFGFIVSFAYMIILLVFNNNINIFETFVSIGAVTTVAVLLISFLFPVVYKFGVERARILLFIIAFMPTIIIVLLSRFNIFTLSEDNIILIFKILPILAIVLLVISFFVSCKIFEKKEL